MDYLRPEMIWVALDSDSKEDSLKGLVDRVVERQVVQEAGTLLEALWAREHIVTTGIGRGIAIPHADLPEITHPQLALGVYPAGVDFDALDDQLVHLVFMLLGTPRTPGLHMKILARIARLSKDPDLCQDLIKATEPHVAIEILRRTEQRH